MATVKICDGRTALYQWDVGVRLEMCGCSHVTECHFVTPDGVIKRDVVDNICDVPDAALKQAGKLIVYAFARTEEEGTTRHEFRLAVYSRPKPADYVDPPDEVDNLQALAERVAQLIPGGGGGGGSISAEDDGAGNVVITLNGFNVTHDGAGNVCIA